MSTVTRTSESTPATSSRGITLQAISVGLAIVGLAITGYLSYTHLFETEVVCIEGGAFSCDTVNSSVWSRFMGIPVAYLGFAAWLTIGAILLLEKRVSLLRDFGVALVFGLSLFGFLYHSYLTYTSVFIIQSLCPWCLAAHATMTVLFIVSSARLYQSMRAA